MQSRLLIAALLASSVVIAAQPLCSQDAPPAAGQSAGQTPESHGHPHRPLPKPVNLQVLPKDTSPEQVVHIMRGITGALGVDCNFCHAPNPTGRGLDFASDAKPEKATARIMMRMTNDINDNFMAQVKDPDATEADKHVTCGTCHRGHSMPEHFVPPPEEHHGPPRQQGGTPEGGEPAGTPPPQ